MKRQGLIPLDFPVWGVDDFNKGQGFHVLVSFLGRTRDKLRQGAGRIIIHPAFQWDHVKRAWDELMDFKLPTPLLSIPIITSSRDVKNWFALGEIKNKEEFWDILSFLCGKKPKERKIRPRI